MRDEQTLSDRVAAALARANEIEATTAAAIEQLRIDASERGNDGRPTAKAKTARQKLASPALSSTLASVALRDRINPALNTAIDEVERAEIAFSTAVSALRALQARKELFDGAKGAPIKRVVNIEVPELEEWKFIGEMRARNVPVTAMDQLSEPELDFIAGLIVEKQKDARHRHRTGAWWALVRAGLLDVASEAFNDDERAAILAARNDGIERAREAYDALCAIAGRQLDIPHSFAEFAVGYARESALDDPIGAFERNVDRLKSDQKRIDVERLLELLGLPVSELARALALTTSRPVVTLRERMETERVADEQRAEDYRQLIDRYRPAARRALAERHDAERQQERELLGADALGIFDQETALRKLSAYDDEPPPRNAAVIRQVRAGTYLEDREDERRRTVERLARELAVSDHVRQTVAGMGIALPDISDPDGDEDTRLLEAIAPAPPPASEPVDMTPRVPPSPNAPPPAPPEPEGVALPAVATRDSLVDLDLPADVSPEAALAYYDIARRFVLAGNDWWVATWPHADADRSDPASIAAMLGRFEQADGRSALDEVSRGYLTILREQSIVEADDYLVDLQVTKIIREVADGALFEDLRKDAGFPRPAA